MSSPEEEKRRESEKQKERDEKDVTGEEYRLTAKERSQVEMVISRVEMVMSKISIEPAVILMSLGWCMFGVPDHFYDRSNIHPIDKRQREPIVWGTQSLITHLVENWS